MKKMLILFGVVLMLGAILAACDTQVITSITPVAANAVTATPELIGNSLRGGRLYDIWFEELGVDAPKDVSPLWATSTTAGETTPEDSWRCAVCHGFDYKGDLGFPGIIASAGKDPNEILAVLKGSKDPKHDFSAYLDDQSLTDIALFVSNEQIDVTAIVTDNKPVNGNADNGKTLFDNTCKDCHGPEGLALAINFGPDSPPEYPATVAENGPRLLHKLRFGQPGARKMPSGIDNSWANQDYADVIAFIQALPTASPVTDVTKGGRMFDNWLETLGVDAPETDQPLWIEQKGKSGLTGGDTWLCSTCHGLDYKGVDGINAEGTDGYTGFPGILAAKDLSSADLTGWLDGTKNPNHDFSSYFNKDEMAQMVAFMQQGVQDRSVYFNADGTVKGDAAHGKTLYNSICQDCHGADGKSINFAADEGGNEYLGTVATAEPWGTFHVGTFGEPRARIMPAGMNLGWSQQDIADLLAFLQTLPTQ